MLQRISKKQSETNEAINKIRRVTKEINSSMGVIKDSTVARSFKAISQPMLDSLKKVEEELTQSKAVTDYDLFNYPNKLNDKLAGLRESVASADAAPTPQAFLVFDELSAKIDLQIKKLKAILDEKLAAVNKFVEEQRLYLIKEEKN